MSHNNDSGKFFKFKNLQLVCRQNTARQTRQNTDLRTQGTAEEQFAAIAAAACAEALNDIDDILSDDESVDYSPPKQQPLVGLLEWFRMKQTKMYVCTLEEFILVEIWIHCCTKLN